jgi:hypothetical protein
MIGVTGGIAAHVGHVHPTPEVLTQVRKLTHYKFFVAGLGKYFIRNPRK